MGEVKIVVKVPEGVDKKVMRSVIEREIERLELLRSVVGTLPKDNIDQIIEEIESGFVP